MTTDTPDDAVPAEKVRELIAEWRDHPTPENATAPDPTPAGWAVKDECADELEALLADVEGERDE